ncbi:MAG: PASTA domain-containing protein [Fimbriimonas sp.]|nr:PASTA domain-containing protein [Fimbriimonas sp.]
MIGKLLKARYEIVGLIQDGPVFATYSARDKIQGRDVSVRVVKQPFAEETEFVDRLVSTIQKYAIIQSANIERLHSVESDQGIPFILGDLTRGPSLADRIKKLAPFSVPVSVGTAISILHALDAVHRTGLVHGDLNPHHMAVMADGDVRLQMTGVWEAYSGSPTAGIMVLPGMAPYLAPEVSAGAMPNTCSDVYAVGILLFELISGRLPYFAETPLAMALQHSTAATPNVRTSNTSIPSVLDEIIKKAMSKDPRSRYASAGEMLADLRILQDALRFGRSLTWPLRPEHVQPGPAATGRGPASKPQPVAPRMSAIRGETEQLEVSRKKQRAERDVPVWMLVVFTFVLAIFGSICLMWIYMSLSRPRMVTVPNIKGLSVTEATSLLKDSKLILKVASREPNDTVDQDSVLDVRPERGEKVREGGVVYVVLSSGSRMVAVPEMVSLTVDKAKALLATLNLTVEPRIERISDPKIAPDLIVRSDPPAREKVARQSQIKLYVSSGPSEETTSSRPAENDGYLYTLHLKLKDLPHPTRVRIEIIDDNGRRSVYDQMHDSGDKFDVTTHGAQQTATFNIYYDGVLVMSKDKQAEGDEASNDTLEPDSPNGGTPQ